MKEALRRDAIYGAGSLGAHGKEGGVAVADSRVAWSRAAVVVTDVDTRGRLKNDANEWGRLVSETSRKRRTMRGTTMLGRCGLLRRKQGRPAGEREKAERGSGPRRKQELMLLGRGKTGPRGENQAELG